MVGYDGSGQDLTGQKKKSDSLDLLLLLNKMSLLP